jgi:hypothetical protein
MPGRPRQQRATNAGSGGVRRQALLADSHVRVDTWRKTALSLGRDWSRMKTPVVAYCRSLSAAVFRRCSRTILPCRLPGATSFDLSTPSALCRPKYDRFPMRDETPHANLLVLPNSAIGD